MTHAHIPIFLVCLLLVVPATPKPHGYLTACRSPPLQGHHAQAAVTNLQGGRNARTLSSTTKLAFVSSSLTRTTPPGPSNIKVHTLWMRLSATNPRQADEVNEEECSLQTLFKEVQQNDSQWYDNVFSSLVDEDEADAALRAACGTDDGFLFEGQPDSSSQIDATNGKRSVLAEDKVEEQSEIPQVDDEASEKPGTSPLRSDAQVEDLVNSSQTEEVLNIDDDQSVVEGVNNRGIGTLEDERTRVTLKSTSSNIQSILTDRAETRKTPKHETDNQQPSQQSIRTLVLRNKFTNDVETLAPISILEDLGYTEKEINVLKPQVLELIIEDEIKRPSKGLPKRWVRLGKLEGFQGSREDENDFDYGWEIEINQDYSPIDDKPPEEEPPRKERSSARSKRNRILSAEERPNRAREYNYYDEEPKSARNRRRKRRNTTGPIIDRQRPRRQRDLRIDRNVYDDEIPPNRFWMVRLSSG